MFLLGSATLFAQVHGPAPSVNSFTGRSLGVGPAPSVNSVGPRGWQSGPCLTPACVNPVFTPTVNFSNGTVQFGQHFNTGHNGHHRGNRGGYVYSYGYAYPVYVPVAPVEEQPPDQVYEQPDAPAPTVFENRSQVRLAPNPTPVEDSRYGQHYLDQREQEPPAAAATAPGAHNMSPVSEEQIPVVIVFKDGHQQEVKNYAIMGDTLYDLGTFVAHKIKLADLDLQQTIEKNEQRGVEFNVPASYKPVG